MAFYGAYFLCGALLTNAVPHVVSGLMGKPIIPRSAVRSTEASGPFTDPAKPSQIEALTLGLRLNKRGPRSREAL